MENFRTTLLTRLANSRMSLGDSILTIGSCFSDAIGNELVRHKIRTLVNPFGTVYNPYSIHKSLVYAAQKQLPRSDTFLHRDGTFYNYDFHSRFAAATQFELANLLQAQIETTHSFLKNAHWLIVTYGTSWVYERHDVRETVANCHKLPQSQFSKTLMSHQKILQSFADMHGRLKAVNPSLKIIVTVSPVRHIKDTLELNSVSKSILRVACHTLQEQYDDVEYFPSYEIMMDDLRDYRFYNADMIHPSPVAEHYIWTKFIERYFDERLLDFCRQWKEIINAIDHKAFQPNSNAHQLFLQKTLHKLEELKPLVNVDKETAILKTRLIRE